MTNKSRSLVSCLQNIMAFFFLRNLFFYLIPAFTVALPAWVRGALLIPCTVDATSYMLRLAPRNNLPSMFLRVGYMTAYCCCYQLLSQSIGKHTPQA